MRRLAATLTLLLTASLLGAPAPAQAVTPSSTPNSLTTSPDVARTIVGTVRDTAGRPVAGACVDVHSNQWLFLAHACTDADGHYEVGAIPDQLANFRLQAVAPGYAARWWPASVEYNGGTSVSVPLPGTPRTVDFVLPTTAEASGKIAGVIRRQDGTPASGAVVRAYVAAGGSSETVYSKSDGSYVLSGLTAGQYLMQVYGAGYPTQYVPGQTLAAEARPQTVAVGATTTVDETFLPMATIPPATMSSLTGTVRDPAGAAIEGATVRLLSPLAYTGETMAQTVTGPDGRFTLTGLAQDSLTYYLQTSAAGYATAWAAGSVMPTSINVNPGGSTVDVVLRLGAGAITGTLHDFDGSTPPRTQLTFISVDNAVAFRTVVWFDGHFEVPNVPAGQYRLSISPAGRPSQYWPRATDSSQAGIVTVTDRTTTDVEETLLTPGRIEVTVLDDLTGQPVTGACVKGNTAQWNTCAPAVGPGVYVYVSSALYSTTFAVTASRDPDLLPAYASSVSAVLGQVTQLTLRLRPAAMLGLDLTVPAGATMPAQVCFRAVTTVPFQPETASTGCRPVTSGHVVIGPVQPGPGQVFLYVPSGATSLGALWVTDAGGGGDQRQARLFSFEAGQTVTAPAQHLLLGGTISGSVTGPGADTSAVCPGPVLSTGAGSSSWCEIGYYAQYYLGPYRWPISLTANGVNVGWSGSGTNRFNAAYVQVISGKTTSADITLRPVSPIGLTVTGVPAGSWTLTAYDPVTGDQVSSAAGAASILVTGPVVLRLSAPSLAQPCYVGIPHAAAPGRRAQPAYVIDPVAQLTITPGGNCLSTTTPSLQAGTIDRR